MSTQLRRQIRARRKPLKYAVELCEADLQSDVSPFINSSSHDTLLDYIETLHNHRETILTKLNKLEKLNDDWTKLMTANNEEINKAIEILEQIDTHEVLIMDFLAQEGIHYEAEQMSSSDQRQQNNEQQADDKNNTSFASQLHATSTPVQQKKDEMQHDGTNCSSSAFELIIVQPIANGHHLISAIITTIQHCVTKVRIVEGHQKKAPEGSSEHLRRDNMRTRNTARSPPSMPMNNPRHVNFSTDVTTSHSPNEESDVGRTNVHTSCVAVTHTTSASNTSDDYEQQINKDPTLLMCAKVTLVNPKDPIKQLRTVAFLDSGSSHSYITSDAAEHLDLDSVGKEITLHTFGSIKPASMPVAA
ncbi:unnamed protein product [Heligmosomoides polygyrus]|uniref:DUF1758 domain-containing protein n=1 Tax=Heligmosomoides polygyrus TaxID=6339 RepID=A0A183GCT7_HELPZ|nr:unnamed protein product [Heligmosomoides polygyrus]